MKFDDGMYQRQTGSLYFTHKKATFLLRIWKPNWLIGQTGCLGWYTGGGNVWCDIAKYIVKWTWEKWPCDSHDDATPLPFQLQEAEDDS